MKHYKNIQKASAVTGLLTLSLLLGQTIFSQMTPKATAQPAQTYCSVCKHPNLARGVNLYNWFMGPTIYSPGHQDSFMTDTDIARLKTMGFTHVRLPLYAKFLADITKPDAPLRTARVAALDKAMQRLAKQGLSVVLVMYAEDDSRRLVTVESAHQSYAALWRQLASRYRSYSPRQVYFELLNEPHFQAYVPNEEAKARWQTVHHALLAAVRQAAPQHQAIIATHDWDTVQSLIKVETPISDPHVIYTAHFYEFMLFTHQGLPKDFEQFKGIPYPVEKASCLEALAALPPATAAAARFYCDTGFNRQKIDTQFRQLRDWSQRHNVPVYVGEFGAYQKYAPPGSSSQWLADVRESAEKYQIPWAYWSYTGEMGLMDDYNQPKASVGVPLGLKKP